MTTGSLTRANIRGLPLGAIVSATWLPRQQDATCRPSPGAPAPRTRVVESPEVVPVALQAAPRGRSAAWSAVVSTAHRSRARW